MWSKLTNTSIRIQAEEYYALNNCAYHNWSHVNSMYEYLERTNQPYDEALDYAVMFHDIVYDNLPNKEIRSADYFDYVIAREGVTFPEQMHNDVREMILATINHTINKNTDQRTVAIIKADLHQLANIELALENYVKIYKESKRLYSVTSKQFAEGNSKFMNNLKLVMQNNYTVDGDMLWLNILNGIQLTTAVSNAIIELK